MSWSLVLQLPFHCMMACTGNALVIGRYSLALCPLVAHWSSTPHGFCVTVETAIFVSALPYSSLPSVQHHPRQRSRFSLRAALALWLDRPAKIPARFLETFLGLVETTSLHLFPLHRTAPSRHIHAASARSLYRLPLTALPAHPPQERRVCAVRIMKKEIINPSTSPEASSNSLTPGDGPPRKKQKRNKPTLSCEECVERKTKVRCCPCFERCRNTCVISEVNMTLTNAQCDRSRPNCLACIKRQSVCKFSEIANLIAAGADV